MAKIYVSSTFLDLQEYRTQVEKVIRRMGHTDVAMEYYVAEDQRPVDRCLSDVEACDLYIGVFAWRYGWIPTKKNRKKISVTEMEYRQAQKSQKPCLIFLLDGKAAWLPDFIDDDKTQIKKLRNEVSEAHNTGPGFKTADELGRMVAEAIHNWEKEQGLIQAITSIPEYNLTTYYEALRKRYNVLALEGLTPPQKEEYLQIQLRQVFVEQSVREDTPPVELPKEVWEKLSREKEIHEDDLPSGITLDDVRKARESYYKKPSQLVLDALTDARNQYTIILGDPGSGKSTLARYAMLSLIDPALAGDKIQKVFDGYLPLLIELRAFVGACADGKCETPLEFLEHLGKTEGWGLTQIALHNHLKNDGRAVVIFDGLDEIFEPKMRETITSQIVGFTNTYPKARVIVTSRILGYRRKILSDAGFTHFTLQDLNEEQVREFITNWYDLAMSDRPEDAKERSERILKSFKDSSSIRQLAGNPMLLTIMAIIGKHQELPRERWKLYDHAASVLIQHWDVNKHLKDENLEADFIGEDDKKELLRRLAYRMQNGDGGLAGNYIHREGLQEEFETYLKERYSQTPDRAKVIAEAMIQQFRERNFILSLYGANLYGFVHRAFLEYFCASAFVWKFEKTKELSFEEIKTDIYGRHWKDKNWHEVLQLICGMIDEKWVGNIIESLLDIDYKEEADDDDDIIFSEDDIIFSEDDILSLLENYSYFDTRYAIDISRFIFLAHKNVKLHLSAILLNEAGNINLLHSTILQFVQHKNWRARVNALTILSSPKNRYFGIFSLLQECAQRDKATQVRTEAILKLARYYREDTATLYLLRERAVQDADPEVRYAAVSALAEHYREDAQTLPFLQERAVNDIEVNLRCFAMYTLVKNYKDNAQTLLLVRDRAVNDAAANMRSSAVSALAKNFKEDVQTLPLVRDRAVNDAEADVRSAAVSALAENFKEDVQTLPLVRDRAVNDAAANVRSSAVSALAKNFKEDAQTLPLLRDRAVNDESPKLDDKKEHLWETYVRDAAIEVIAKNWHDHPDTLPLLRDRMENDPTPWLRERCKALIKKIEGKKE